MYITDVRSLFVFSDHHPHVKHVHHCLDQLDWQNLRTPLMCLCMNQRVCYKAHKLVDSSFSLHNLSTYSGSEHLGGSFWPLMIWPDNKTTQKVLEEVFWSLGLITTWDKKIKTAPHLIGFFSFMVLYMAIQS